MFSRDGEFLRAIGRRGEGPGEFVDPVELGVLAGDTLVVWDWGSGRVVLFGPDGSHGRTIRLQPPVVSPTGHVGMLGRQGIAVGNHDVRFLDTGLAPQFLQVLRYSWSGALFDTLVTLRYGERRRVNPESSMMGNPLFEPRGVFSTHGDRLYTSDGESPEVHLQPVCAEGPQGIPLRRYGGCWRAPGRDGRRIDRGDSVHLPGMNITGSGRMTNGFGIPATR